MYRSILPLIHRIRVLITEKNSMVTMKFSTFNLESNSSTCNLGKDCLFINKYFYSFNEFFLKSDMNLQVPNRNELTCQRPKRVFPYHIWLPIDLYNRYYKVKKKKLIEAESTYQQRWWDQFFSRSYLHWIFWLDSAWFASYYQLICLWWVLCATFDSSFMLYEMIW